MNTNLLNIIKQIVAEQGDDILANPKRVSAFFADLARDIPKPEKNALLRSLEHGFAQIMRNAAAPDREDCKQQLTQRLNNEEGFDLSLCGETVDLLAEVVFGPGHNRASAKTSAAPSPNKTHFNNAPAPAAPSVPMPPMPVFSTSAMPAATATAPNVDSTMKRGWLFLEDSNWGQAGAYFNAVLDIDPEYAPAYIGLLCAQLNIRNQADLENAAEPLENMPHFQKALRFADVNYRAELDKCSQINQDRIQQKQQRQEEADRKLEEQERTKFEQRKKLQQEAEGSLKKWRAAAVILFVISAAIGFSSFLQEYFGIVFSFNIISFLILFFSSGNSRVLRFVFLVVGILWNVMFMFSDLSYSSILVVASVGFISSLLIALKFPKDKLRSSNARLGKDGFLKKP
jgi:tetratricopeptide (TPR) repeat protein